MGRVLWLLLYLVTSAGPAKAALPGPAPLPGTLNGVDLTPYLGYWYDAAESSSLDAAQAALEARRFSGLPRHSVNMGFAQGHHWFHVQLHNRLSSARTVWLEVDYPVLDQLEFFCSAPGREPLYVRAGDHVQFGSRPVKVRNYVVPLPLDAGATAECLMRAHSTSNVVFPLRVFDALSFIEKTHRMEWALGVLYGLALALLLYNLAIYVSTRDPMYLFFVLHVLGGLGYAAGMDGTLARFWIGLDLQDLGLLISICLSAGTGILFGLEFLDIPRTWPKANRAGTVLFVVLMGYAVAMLFMPLMLSHRLSAVLMTLVGLFLFGVGVRRWHDGFAPARIYLLGYGTVTLMVVWMALNVLYLRADVRWITYGMSLVWLFELAVLSLALGYRIRLARQERTQLSEQVQTALRESNSKTEFMTKVSHEIRTPMSGIMGLVELLLDTDLDLEQRRYLHAVRHAGQGLQEVINDVLDFSRIEAGKLSLQNKPFDLQQLLQDLCAIYEFDARRQQIELGCFIAAGTPLQLIGDAQRIRQVLLNVLSNALKYTERGFVHINVQLTDQILSDQLMLRFEVEDSGVGISPRDQRRLFQRFSQIPHDRPPVTPGSGLGLVISQQIVELMGGEMGVQSEPGKGSCFWFQLPLALPETVQVADSAIALNLFDGAAVDDASGLARPSRSPLASPQARARILVVEDNGINQEVMQGFLRRLGLVADVAENGRIALDWVRQGHRYEVILMDCEMPVMDGYESASRILKWQHESGQTPTPIVALSAHALDRHREMAFAAGMVDYLAKPVSYPQLVERLARHMDLPVDAALR